MLLIKARVAANKRGLTQLALRRLQYLHRSQRERSRLSFLREMAGGHWAPLAWPRGRFPFVNGHTIHPSFLALSLAAIHARARNAPRVTEASGSSVQSDFARSSGGLSSL